MATLSTNLHQPSGEGGPSGPGVPPYVLRPVLSGELTGALARLLCAEDDLDHVRRFERQAAIEGTDLSLVWGTFDRDSVSPQHAPAPRTGADNVVLPRHACLALRAPGRTATLMLSGDHPTRHFPSDIVMGERAALLRVACDLLAGPQSGGVMLAQTIVEPAAADLIDAYLHAGFARLATLAYMSRSLAKSAARGPAEVPGVRLVPLADLPPASAQRLLHRALELTYEHTLDCPALCGMREVGDVIDSHRAVGHYDPALWYIAFDSADSGDEPIGCILLSAVGARSGDAAPASGSASAGAGSGAGGSGGGAGGAGMWGSASAPRRTVELVYLGLARAARGRGLGAALLRFAAAVLAGRGHDELVCAVDVANTPAMRLYHAAKFRQTQTKVALVRPLGTRS